MRRLKTAVLGLDERSKILLEAASKVDAFQIEAVADKDTELAKKTAQKYDCSYYDDYRRLIIENQFDSLLVAAGFYSCDECIRAAIKKKCNILKLTPLARTFEEAAEFARLAEAEGVKFVVANSLRFSDSFAALRRYLQEVEVGQINLISASCNLADNNIIGWHSDRKLSGGGVLLRNCYEIIDQIIWNFGIPQQVYALSTSTAGDRKQRLYLTEDMAVLTMKFSDTLLGNLVVSRHAEAKEQILKLYAKEKNLTVTNSGFTVCGRSGDIIENFEYNISPQEQMVELLNNFAAGILSPDKNRLYSLACENLKNMALLESAYLSSRTSMPEEPERILKMASLPEDMSAKIWPINSTAQDWNK